MASEASGMATVLIKYEDGNGTARAYFQLVEGKLHLPTIRDYFKLANAQLNGIVYPIDDQGFTFTIFMPGDSLTVTGVPEKCLKAVMAATTCRVLLVKVSEHITHAADGKRRVVQSEENLGLWNLPPQDKAPNTMAELTAAIRTFLQADEGVSWMFKYKYFEQSVPINSDKSLQDAMSHFRATALCLPEKDAASYIKLYLTELNEETRPRALIRARISGLLDAAVARTSQAELLPAAGSAAGTSSMAAAAAAAAADTHADSGSGGGMLHAMASQQLPLQYHGSMQHLMMDGGVDAFIAAEGSPQYTYVYGSGSPSLQAQLASPLVQLQQQPQQQQRQQRQEGQMQEPMKAAAEVLLPLPNDKLLKKETKTRYADGRFKSEQQHQQKMNDMLKKCHDMFDGCIQGLFELQDHKKIKCKVCGHVATAYSAYHTDCLRKHFLRHHEALLKERFVDVNKWRKDYEISARRKKETQELKRPTVVALLNSVSPQAPQQGLVPDAASAQGHHAYGLQKQLQPAGVSHSHMAAGSADLHQHHTIHGPSAAVTAAGAGMGGLGETYNRADQQHIYGLPLPQQHQPLHQHPQPRKQGAIGHTVTTQLGGTIPSCSSSSPLPVDHSGRHHTLPMPNSLEDTCYKDDVMFNLGLPSSIPLAITASGHLLGNPPIQPLSPGFLAESGSLVLPHPQTLNHHPRASSSHLTAGTMPATSSEALPPHLSADVNSTLPAGLLPLPSDTLHFTYPSQPGAVSGIQLPAVV